MLQANYKVLLKKEIFYLGLDEHSLLLLLFAF